MSAAARSILFGRTGGWGGWIGHPWGKNRSNLAWIPSSPRISAALRSIAFDVIEGWNGLICQPSGNGVAPPAMNVAAQKRQNWEPAPNTPVPLIDALLDRI